MYTLVVFSQSDFSIQRHCTGVPTSVDLLTNHWGNHLHSYDVEISDLAWCRMVASSKQAECCMSVHCSGVDVRVQPQGGTRVPASAEDDRILNPAEDPPERQCSQRERRRRRRRRRRGGVSGSGSLSFGGVIVSKHETIRALSWRGRSAIQRALCFLSSFSSGPLQS